MHALTTYPYSWDHHRVLLHRGLGDLNPGNLISEAGGLTSAGASLAISLGASASGTLGSMATLAGPIGAIAGALTVLFMNLAQGCGSSCTMTSDAANQVGSHMSQNLQAYFAGSRTKSEQQAHLALFDAAWQQLVNYCSNSAFGSAGQRCISDRQKGSCKWKANLGHFDQCTWVPATDINDGHGTQCWDWFIDNRDPIANDPCVQPDTPTTAALGQQLSALGISAGSTDLTPLLIAGGLILLAVML